MRLYGIQTTVSMAEIAHSQRLLPVRLLCRGCKFRPFSHANSPRLSLVRVYAWRFWPIVSAFVFSQRQLSLLASMHNTPGPDNIPPLMVNTYAHLLAAPGTAISNSSLREGKLPDLWEIATVVPVPKKHPPGSLESDIRPILARVVEAIILNCVDDVISPQIDERQFGRFSGTGTTDALVEMVHTCYGATDQ